MNPLLLDWLAIQVGRRELEIHAYVRQLTARIDEISKGIDDRKDVREVKARMAAILAKAGL